MRLLAAALLLLLATLGPASAEAIAKAPDSYEFQVMIRPVETIKKLLKFHGKPEANDAFTYIDRNPRIVVMPPFPMGRGAYFRWWMDLFRHEHDFHVIDSATHSETPP